MMAHGARLTVHPHLIPLPSRERRLKDTDRIYW
jgi:hypothetical protein